MFLEQYNFTGFRAHTAKKIFYTKDILPDQHNTKNTRATFKKKERLCFLLLNNVFHFFFFYFIMVNCWAVDLSTGVKNKRLEANLFGYSYTSIED
jgi:hypothetical protein